MPLGWYEGYNLKQGMSSGWNSWGNMVSYSSSHCGLSESGYLCSV